MSTEAQIQANQQNARHSTGPKTDETKAISSMNNFRHGLAGAFHVLPSENQEEFDQLLAGLSAEHQPATITESLLIEKMAEHYWLGQRALRCQHACFVDGTLTMEDQSRRLSLFLRYQTTHQRAFHRSLNDLLKLRAEKRKAEIGFELQKQKAARQQPAECRRQAAESRREAAEKRKEERHKWDISLIEAKMNHQMVLTSNLELDRELAEMAKNDTREAKKAA